jgi:hypothetical protein
MRSARFRRVLSHHEVGRRVAEARPSAEGDSLRGALVVGGAFMDQPTEQVSVFTVFGDIEPGEGSQGRIGEPGFDGVKHTPHALHVHDLRSR